MKQSLTIFALGLALILQSGCGMTSPVQTAVAPMTTPDVLMLGIGAGAGAGLGEMALGNNIGGVVGGAAGLVAANAYLSHAKEREAQLVAEAKEEARREERAKLMQDYWLEAAGQDSVGSYSNSTRDVRYDAGVYDGVAYEKRNLPRQLYFQEPPR